MMRSGSNRGRESVRAHASRIGIVAGILIGSSVCMAAPDASLARLDDRQNADQLLIVDCLLPAQVRQLGTGITYLAPRRAVKATGADCAIRGGEYVAYDRANYTTALKVWLPSAETGDKVAQTYVGEIYERGLGTPPDYAMAAAWYQKAAAQGYPRALINLGFLYEKGLGVSKDPAMALNLYRQASGIGGSITLDGAPPAPSAAELDALRKELERTRQELEKARRALDEERVRSSQEIERLTQRKLEAAAAGNAEETRRLEALLKEREAELEKRRQQVAQYEQTTEGYKAQLARLAGETAPKEELDALRRELERTRGDLDKARRALDEERVRSSQEIERLTQRKLQAAAAGNTEETRRLEALLKEREAELEKRRQQVAQYEQATEGYKAQLARLAGETAPKEELDALRRELERTRGDLDKARRALDEERIKAAAETESLLQKKLQAAAAGNAEETRKLESLLKEREGELERRRQQVARFEQVTEDYKARLARLEGESASLRQELEQARRQVAQSQNEIEDKKNVAAESERRLAAMQQEIARQRAAASPIDPARIKALEAEVEKSRAEFTRQKQEIARLETAVAGYREKVAELETRPEPPKQVVAMAPPAIQIIDPPIVTTRDSAAVKVRAGVATRPVVGRVVAAAGLLSFTANDLPLNVDADGYFTTSADLGRGRTQVTLVAVDRQGKRTLLEFFMEADAAAAGADATAPPRLTAQQLRLGKYYALVIGNQKYEHLPRLNTPEADATDIATLLTERYGFAVTVLLNATRKQMLQAVNVIRQQVTEKDNLLIYYAGHGQYDSVNSLANWLPIDAEPNDNTNWIANSTITENLNLMSAKHILVVADSCYSGAMTRSSIGQLLPGMSEEQRRDWLRSFADKKSRNVLTSGGVEPVMDGGGGKHSIFAQNLIDILSENQDALLGVKLFEVISARVVSTTKRMQIEQRPEYAPIRFAGGESGDFIFVLP